MFCAIFLFSQICLLFVSSVPLAHNADSSCDARVSPEVCSLAAVKSKRTFATESVLLQGSAKNGKSIIDSLKQAAAVATAPTQAPAVEEPADQPASGQEDAPEGEQDLPAAQEQDLPAAQEQDLPAAQEQDAGAETDVLPAAQTTKAPMPAEEDLLPAAWATEAPLPAASDSAKAPHAAAAVDAAAVTQIAPFGREDTSQELQSHAAKTQDTLVDALENAEVAEIKRAVFRSLTRLRAAEIKEFDTIARLETQALDEYNDAHHYRAENPLDYLHSSEAEVKEDKYTSFHD